MPINKPSADVKTVLRVRDDDHSAGPDTAVITAVAYCDFACPYCGRAYPVIKRLRARLGDRLRFVFRHFPLVRKHPFAQQAAEASEAADAQDQFWPMHDLLFEHQQALAKEDLTVYAEYLDLDIERFNRALAKRVFQERVDWDIANGQQIGVHGTPTFFINGSRHTDEDTLEDLVLRMSERAPT
jgi:formate-nitrite transporter family protein